MAGRVRQSWRAGIRSIGRAFVHKYSDDGRTCLGARYKVHVRIMLEREPEREVFVHMTPTEARKWAHALLQYADVADAENNVMGTRSED